MTLRQSVPPETPEQRKARVREWAADRSACLRCGYLRANVRHEPDPANAPEGPEYFATIRGQMHAFQEPSR